MPTTITAAFVKLRENLEITDLQGSTVSTRQKNVREAIEKEMTVINSFLGGSYARSTMIGPLSKGDILTRIAAYPAHRLDELLPWIGRRRRRSPLKLRDHARQQGSSRYHHQTRSPQYRTRGGNPEPLPASS